MTDQPGDLLLQAVAVMDRLRSPGGCPWDAEQTHASLARYLVEETYELFEAIEHLTDGVSGDGVSGDDVNGEGGKGRDVELREELGDVLLQVLFHARIADSFGIDDVAGDLAAKLIRRHPHVFPPAAGAPAEQVATASDQQSRWDELKKTETGRHRVLSGVATGQPAAALAAKLGARAVKYAVDVPLPEGDGIGEQLFRLAYAAGARGEDAEMALRRVALDHARAMAANQTAIDPERTTDSANRA